MSRKRPPSNARPGPALVRNDAAESSTWARWGGGVVRLLGALRQDGWRSTLGGLGSRADRGRPGSLEFIDQLPLTDEELTAAYRNLWLVRRLVEDLSNEALREGFGIEQDDIPEFMRLNYGGYHSEGAFERALRMAELKGGAGIYVGYSDVFGPEDALQPAPEGEAEVTFLETFDRFQLQGEQPDTDTHSPTFDQSQIWCVSGQRRAGMRFHTSRMIKFKGAPLAGDLGLAQQDREWGDSSLQAVWTDVQRYGVFWQSVAHLLQVSSVGVVSLSGLIDMLASQNQDVARDRIELMNEAMSITRLFLLDASKGESYHREAVSFSDMPALLQEVQLATAGAFRRPVTKLFGRAPAGLNATGESDMRSWYDEVECYRERQVKPALRALLAITDGIEPDAIEFPPLWQPTEQEMAAARKVDNEADQVLWTMRAVSAEEIRRSRYEGRPLAELMKGPPPEDAGDMQQANAQQPEPDPNEDPNADVSAEDVQAAGYSTDATDDVELDEADALALIASGGWELHEDAFRPPRNYKKGPRGGFYYLTAGGKKVYLRKREAPTGTDPKAPEPPKPVTSKLKAVEPPKPGKRSSEEAQKARKERAAQRKKAASDVDHVARELAERDKQRRVAAAAEQKHREARIAAERSKDAEIAKVRGGPQTRAGAERALRQHFDALHIGNRVGDHEVINAYHELKAAGLEQMYPSHRRQPNLVLGATVVANPANGGPVPISTIQASAGGQFSADFHRHGQRYIKVSENHRDLTPELRVRRDESIAQINNYRRAQGLPEMRAESALGLASRGEAGWTVETEGRRMTTTLVHEFGHAVHLERFGRWEDIDRVVLTAYHQNRAPVSGYGETDHREYFAESFAAYRLRRSELKQRAPAAYKMVEDVLKLRGIPLEKD